MEIWPLQPAGVPHFHLSAWSSPLSLSLRLHLWPISRDNPVHLCTSKGCDSESLCQVYFDVDKRPHKPLLGLGMLMERKLLPVAPAPWLEVQRMDSSSQMASQYIVTGCGQRTAQCHHVEGCGHCSGLNNVSLKFIPPGASKCKPCLFGNRVFADELL